MAINRFLLKSAKLAIKEAFIPPEAPPGGPPMDPSMMGGAPPMDPSMMGGAPPPGGAPPMDPSMGAPPMDPSMMGGAPPEGAPPMDPSMMGGAPPGGASPMDPSMIKSIVQQEMQNAAMAAKSNKPKKAEGDSDKTEVYMLRIQKLMTHLYSSLGLNLPHDILDDPVKKVEDPNGQQPGASPAPAQPDSPQAKVASYTLAEKVAGIKLLLKKGRNAY